MFLATHFEKHAKVFKAFCDVNRLRILELLRGGEKCACVLLEQLDLGQSGLSYHMKILVESGVVESRQEGKWTHYKSAMKADICW
jgi:ArsR family transcriptional regulator